MERSDPDDPWDDPLDLGMPGEPEYPLAPLPTHERRWRHPSEIGQAAWVQTDRSSSLGRGLVITSGAIGCMLGLALVWLMVPSAGPAPSANPVATGSDVAASGFAGASTSLGLISTAVASTIASRSTPTTSNAQVLAPTSVAPSPSIEPAQAGTDATPPPTLPPQLPAEDLPSNTVWVKATGDDAQAAVAVVVGDLPYLITTASAVGPEHTVRVVLDSGGTTEAPVVTVAGNLAFVAADDALQARGFPDAAAAHDGETVVVLAQVQITMRYGSAALADVDPASVAEGTPVVNENGSLVGLCTSASGTVSIVPVAPAIAEQTAPSATTTPAATDTAATSQPTSTATATSAPTPSTTAPATTSPVTSAALTSAPATTVTTVSPSPQPAATAPPTTGGSTSTTSPTGTSTSLATAPTAQQPRKAPWMGVRLGGDGSAALAITAITAGSPAEAAGLVVGEQLTTIDGRKLAAVADLLAILDQHAPGDTVVLGVTNANGERQVSVVLGEHERTW